jgi:glycosyltransferase involved in cell wall biosynthesis
MESTKKYGDVIKIKTYLSAGLPTITTEVPPISADIRRLSMGVVVPYDEDQWVMAIDKLLDDPARYALCRSRALEFVRGQTWENILNRAVEETR